MQQRATRFDLPTKMLVPHEPRDDPKKTFADYDLVRTREGNYAIVVSERDKTIAFGDGRIVQLEEFKWQRMTRLPLNARDMNLGPRANFAFLLQPAEPD